MAKDIRVFLVDDHEVVRKGLRSMLNLASDIEVVGEAANADEALTEVKRLSPEIILMDIKLPGMNGIELTRQLTAKYPAIKVIMLTLFDEFLTRAIDAGAAGYLLKDIDLKELLKAIRAVHQGRSLLALSLDRDQLAELGTTMESRRRGYLSRREMTALRLIADGAATKEIAGQLSLSQITVKRIVSGIVKKLGVKNRAQAVSAAHKRGLL